jgi:colanic acid/amylovoran biosynthesis glycosyltransferase
MSVTVALVASTTAEDDAQLLALRLRHLLEHGWDGWLFCKGERWRNEPALRDPNLRERIELAPGAKANSNPFERRLRSLRPELVHFHSGNAAWKGLRKGQLRDSKIAISFRTDGQDLAEKDLDLDLLWERADTLFFRSRAALERALACGCPDERAVILEPPLLLPGPDYRPKRGNGALQVLSAGPLVWEQGFEHSIHAVRLLLDQGVPCEYRIIGDGEHIQAVAFARHQLGLHDYVHLIPEDGIGQLPELLRSADVFVDPAVADATSSSSLTMAQAYAVPFVATARQAPLPDEAGLQVPRRDPRAIATALARLAADPEMRKRMGRRGEEVSGVCRLEDHLAELERLYGATLTGKPV